MLMFFPGGPTAGPLSFFPFGGLFFFRASGVSFRFGPRHRGRCFLCFSLPVGCELFNLLLLFLSSERRPLPLARTTHTSFFRLEDRRLPRRCEACALGVYLFLFFFSISTLFLFPLLFFHASISVTNAVSPFPSSACVFFFLREFAREISFLFPEDNDFVAAAFELFSPQMEITTENFSFPRQPLPDGGATAPNPLSPSAAKQLFSPRSSKHFRPFFLVPRTPPLLPYITHIDILFPPLFSCKQAWRFSLGLLRDGACPPRSSRPLLSPASWMDAHSFPPGSDT